MNKNGTSDQIELCPSGCRSVRHFFKQIHFSFFLFLCLFSCVYPFLSCFVNSGFSGSVRKFLSYSPTNLFLTSGFLVLFLLHFDCISLCKCHVHQCPSSSLLLDKNSTLRLERTSFNLLVNYNFELYCMECETRFSDC